MRANSIIETVGNTPHVRIHRLFDGRVEVWMKLERANPGGSIKDRIAVSMIEDAERTGALKPGYTIIEPTSGNTGIGLAIVAAVKKYRLILVMPESMTIERRQTMTAMGAKLDLTPKEKGMPGAIERAKQLKEEIGEAWIPQQFENESNIEAHRRGTAQEILRDFPEGLDYLITGIGTGGHITACGEVLKPKMPNLKVIGVEPAASAVLSGGKPAPHPIQGIGTGFIPKNLHREVLDGIIAVSADDAFTYARRCALEEGIFVGISSGAALAAVAQKIPEMPKGSRVLTFCYDIGDRYFSVKGLFDQDAGV